MAFLEVRDVNLRRNGNFILKNLSLRIKKGEIHSVIGINGVGKSTLAKAIIGLEEINSGKIFFSSKDISDLSVTERAKLGIRLLMQHPPSFEGIKVREYLKIGTSASLEDLKKAIVEVGLSEDYLERFIDDTLSGGERKRIELASILVAKPKLAILDEPDSGIDLLSLKDLKRMILDLKKEGSSVLLITHREEIAKISDVSSLMCDGKIIKTGEPKEITSYFKKNCKRCEDGLHRRV